MSQLGCLRIHCHICESFCMALSSTEVYFYVSSYFEAHRMIREITGVGNGPFISIHDSFQGGKVSLLKFLNLSLMCYPTGASRWAGFLSGSDRIALEPHPYFAFNGAGSTDIAPYIIQPCQAWGTMMNTSQQTFGVTTAGEWSLAFNDCESCLACE